MAVLCAMLVCSTGVKAQNNPYVDDRRVHFGFQLGLNFMSFSVKDSEVPIVNPLTGETKCTMRE